MSLQFPKTERGDAKKLRRRLLRFDDRCRNRRCISVFTYVTDRLRACHIISRAQGGEHTEKNGFLGCVICHPMADQGITLPEGRVSSLAVKTAIIEQWKDKDWWEDRWGEVHGILLRKFSHRLVGLDLIRKAWRVK